MSRGLCAKRPFGWVSPIYHLELDTGDNIPGILHTDQPYNALRIHSLALLWERHTTDYRRQSSRPQSTAFPRGWQTRLFLSQTWRDPVTARQARKGHCLPRLVLFQQRQQRRKEAAQKQRTGPVIVCPPPRNLKEVFTEQASYWIRTGKRFVSTTSIY